MKGIILAGGSGTRLYPLTLAVSKQLLPIYDKPMIYYPLYTLMSAGIRDVLIITTYQDLPAFERLLGSGRKWGMHIEYAVQNEPRGIAEAFLIGERFIGNDQVTLILGDNIFHGCDVCATFASISKLMSHGHFDATVFAYQVKDPERYGVIEFDDQNEPFSIIEKPLQPQSNWAVTGLYIYTPGVVEVAKSLQPSARGELEITDINRFYLENGKLDAWQLPTTSVWLDTGTHDALTEATAYVQAIEHRQGIKIFCPEEIAWRNGWIDDDQLLALARGFTKTDYGRFLLSLVER